MVTVNIAELKNRLSTYLEMVKRGEEVIVPDRKRAIARLLPLPDDVDEEERQLVAADLMRMPTKRLDVEAFFRMPSGNATDAAVRAIIADMRGEDR